MSRTAMQVAIEIDQFRTICEALPTSKGRLPPSQLAQEFALLGLQSVQGGKKEDENEGKLTPNLISQALAVKKGILSSARAVEILLELEASYGTRSPFHQMSRLHIASTKPSSSQMRDWVMESLFDWLSNDLLEIGEISKTSLNGDKHHTGLVGLFELKKKVQCKSKSLVSMFYCLYIFLLDARHGRCRTISSRSYCPKAACARLTGCC